MIVVVYVLLKCCVDVNIDALNRYGVEPLSQVNVGVFDALSSSTLQLMRYLFPRQFGLHNVFTSVVDSRETVQPFKDYTLREDEINRLKKVMGSKHRERCPKRLRGEAIKLVRKLQILHSRCAYVELLNHYCPAERKVAVSSEDSGGYSFASPNHSHVASGDGVSFTPSTDARFRTQASILQTEESVSSVNLNVESSVQSSDDSSDVLPKQKFPFTDHATPAANVSVFCRSVLNTILPNGFFGSGDIQKHNRNVLNRNIDRFIRLRRFETLSLHEVVQDMKVSQSLYFTKIMS